MKIDLLGNYKDLGKDLQDNCINRYIFCPKLFESLDDATMNKIGFDKWKTFKCKESDDGFAENDFSNIPNDCGGIYSFFVNESYMEDKMKILLYFGKASLTDSGESLRNRVNSYKKYMEENMLEGDKRVKIAKYFSLWRKYLYCSYLPLDTLSNDQITEIENDLIAAYLPPLNEQILIAIVREAKQYAFI